MKRIGLVNGGIVEEVLLPLGQLDFGKGLVGKCDIGLWRTRGEHKSLVGEFAFQLKFARKEDVAEKQKKLAAQFYVTLTAGGGRTGCAGRDQDGNGLSPERGRTAEPRVPCGTNTEIGSTVRCIVERAASRCCSGR